MNTPFVGTRKTACGFTLIELLVVISIIGVLAGLLLPVLGKAKIRGQVVQAKVEITGIMTAISQYEADYHRYPASEVIRRSVNDQYPDFTFGTWYRPVGDEGRYRLVGKKGTCPVVDTRAGGSPTSPSFPMDTSNAEVMSALCDLERFNEGSETPNFEHRLNPKKTRYLELKEVSTPAGSQRVGAPGLGRDGVYRDPWSNPYIISVDLNYDGRCRDGLYRYDSVSRDASGKGINGLGRPPGVPPGEVNNYEANKPFMVWSFGPDGAASDQVVANQAPNKDNVLSWQ